MNSSDITASLHYLNLLTQNLSETIRGGLEQQTVSTVLKLAEQIRSIAQSSFQLYIDIQAVIASKLVDETQQAALQKSQNLLLEIMNQCKGTATSPWSLKKLGSDLSQWKLQFEKILRLVEEIEARQTLQQECQHLYQQTQELQHQTIDSTLEKQRKLDLVKQLIEMEKGLVAIEQNLQHKTRNGHEDRVKLDQVKQAIDEVYVAYEASLKRSEP